MTTTAENFQAYAEMREMEDIEMLIRRTPVPQLFRVFLSLKHTDACAIVLALSEEDALNKVEAKYPEMTVYWQKRQAQLTPAYLAKYPDEDPVARKAEPVVGNFATVYI